MISVLMSVFNESVNDIKISIDSVLSQTYRDFELIIVLDKPDNLEAKELLCLYKEQDERVIILVNDENIGLAMSMNRAASVAKGEYLLRMDADDISTPDRFEIELAAMEEGKYDLVCSDYDFIDENGEEIEKSTEVYTDKQISKLLPLRNVIHHPTVIMTREIFDRVGGYRNYKCAQDYDLWLRFKCAGCKFHMVNKKLLHYRIRTASTTLKHRLRQVMTLKYILSLYGKKMNGYSYDGYLNYLEKHNADSPEAQEDYTKYAELYAKAKGQIKRGKVFRGFGNILKVLFCSKYYRPYIFRGIRISFIKKFAK